MTAVNKIDSNITGLSYAEEASIGVLPGSPVWYPLEPNSYNNFGGQLKLVARNPINASRQRKKGAITDKDANAGFNQDLTQNNLQDILQGFFFADLRRKAEISGFSGVTTSDDRYAKASGLGVFLVNDLIFGTGFANSANNGLHLVDESNAAYVGVAENLADETPASTAKLVTVGHQFGSGDLTIDASGDFPVLGTSSKDLTELGLVAGEFIFIGGDTSATKFATAANNGWARVRSVAAHAIVLDKTNGTMVNDAGTGKTVRVFLGRVLKNETGTDIVRRTYQLERQLGAPDDAQPSEIQAEYSIGSVPNEVKFNIPTADKVTVDMTFVSINTETVTGAEGVKSGTRSTLVSQDAFNTSSDVGRIKLAAVATDDSFPNPLFAFATDLSLTIKNNVSLNKAIGTVGGFDASAGTFEVGGSLEAYFADVTAIRAVEQNTDITLDFAIVAQNAGVVIDVPLIALGNGQLNIEQDQPIKIPLNMEAAIADKVDAAYQHTVLMVFFDYLPDAAE